MLKMCIISSAEDNILMRFIDSLQYVKVDYHCYILRNRQTAVESKENVTIHVVDKNEYIKKEGIQLLKLRIESIELAEPEENDIIMLGDDDMYFQENVDFNFINILGIDIEFIAARTFPRPLVWESCKHVGIHRGHYFRYKQEIWNFIKSKYIECVGGGEDGLIACMHYKYNKGKSLEINLPGVVHAGGNSYAYYNKLQDESSISYLLKFGEDFSLSTYDRALIQKFEEIKDSLTPPQQQSIVR